MLQNNNFGRQGHSKGKSDIVARLTVTRKNGWKTIVTVASDATLHSFYKFHRQYGAKRSTRELFRTAPRSEGTILIGTRDRSQKPGLELILNRLMNYQGKLNPIVSTKLRIIKKRAYRKLINARPDALGMVKTTVNIPMESWRSARAIPVQIGEFAYQGEV